MDPTISFPEEYYTVGVAVTSCMVVGVVVVLLAWRLIYWVRERRSRDHLPLTGPAGGGGGGQSVQKVLDKLFCKDSTKKSKLSEQFIDQHMEHDDDSESSCLKRSSTVHSRTSLISSGSSSHRSSIPPLIVQSCLPQDIHIPERRQSCLSVESGGVELGQVQADCYKSETSEKRVKKSGDPNLIDEEEEDDDASSVRQDNDDDDDDGSDSGDGSIGKLMFSLEHDMHRESLTIVVMKASNLRLTANDGSATDNISKDSTSSGGSRESVTSASPINQQQQQLFDPYIRVLLLPEGKQKAKTRVVRRTKNPIFEETFTFYGISSTKLMQMIIKFSVMTHDRFSKDTCLGHVVLPLTSKLVKRDRQAVTICKNILSGTESMQKQGELFISLNFDSSTDKLTVIVLKGKNFPRMDIAGLADPYVKIYLLCDGQRIDKKKTQVKKRTLNPVFNETFHFTIPTHQLRQHQQRDTDQKHSSQANKSDYSAINPSIMLKFVVLDWDRVSKNEVVGVVQIGPEVVSEVAVKHWNDVMDCPRKQLAVWHKLF